MQHEKKKILKHRIIWFILLFLGILAPIIITNSLKSFLISQDIDYFSVCYAIIIFFIYIDIIIFVFFICSLLLCCKLYEYNGIEIIVYAGWYHHYIKIDGEITDEHNTLISYNAIVLSCTLDDGAEIQATISMTNRISLKINNRLYTHRT